MFCKSGVSCQVKLSHSLYKKLFGDFRFTGAEVCVLLLAPRALSTAVFWPGGGWAVRESGGSGPGRWSCGALVLAATWGTGWEGRMAGSARGRAAGWYRRHRAPPTLWSWCSLVEGHEAKCSKIRPIVWVSVAKFDCRCELTYGLEWYVSKHGTEVVVEEAFEDVQGDVRQAGVNVGVDGQNDSVSTNNAAGGDVTLKHRKH